MPSRRKFLTTLLSAAVGTVVAGDEALALLDKLTHRKVFALGAMPQPVTILLSHWQTAQFVLTDKELAVSSRVLDEQAREAARALSLQIERDILRWHLPPHEAMTVRAVAERTRTELRPEYKLASGMLVMSQQVQYGPPITHPEAKRALHEWDPAHAVNSMIKGSTFSFLPTTATLKDRT